MTRFCRLSVVKTGSEIWVIKHSIDARSIFSPIPCSYILIDQRAILMFTETSRVRHCLKTTFENLFHLFYHFFKDLFSLNYWSYGIYIHDHVGHSHCECYCVTSHLSSLRPCDRYCKVLMELYPAGPRKNAGNVC